MTILSSLSKSWLTPSLSCDRSELVTMFTAPAIVAPVLPNLGISPEIAALAVVHVNDSFFWVVTRFAEMDVSEGYHS